MAIVRLDAHIHVYIYPPQIINGKNTKAFQVLAAFGILFYILALHCNANPLMPGLIDLINYSMQTVTHCSVICFCK